MRIYTLLIAFLWCTHLWADSFENLHFDQINKRMGLSDNNVEVIFKDSEGFVWFGTRNGLCRFDGYEFKTYKTNHNENSLSGNRILDIAEDNAGNIWVGTYKNGLNRLNKKTGKITRFGIETGIGERVNRVKKLSDGSIWICSNWGLAMYSDKTKKFTFYRANSSNVFALKADLVHDIMETRSGEIYVAPEFWGLQKLDTTTGRFTDIYYARDYALATNYRKKIIEDKNGVLWISAHSHGLAYYNPKTKETGIYSAENSDLSTNVLMGNMALDMAGNLWLCTEEDGINIFNIENRTFRYLRKNPDQNKSINSNHIYSVYIDDNNRVWVGTYDKGVNVYNPYKAKFQKTLFAADDLEILEGMSVLDVFEDNKKRVWIGTDGNGLFCFEKTKPLKQFINQPNILSSNIITAIGGDYMGNILLGTYTGGLISYNPEKNRSKIFLPDYKHNNSVTSPNVWELFTDSKQRIWLGLLGTGVDEFLPESQKFINHGPFSEASIKIDFPNVMVITEDTDGDIWFGTEGRGIFILDAQVQKIFQIPNDTVYKVATNGIIKCIIQDKWGYFWIGTEDNGLFTYDKSKKEFTKVNIPGYHPSDPVLGVQEDNVGNLWIATSNGLFRWNRINKKFNHFEIKDGLSSDDFNADAMCKLTDGRILVGSKNGADVVDPNLIKLNQTLPKIIFTKLNVLNQEVKCHDTLNGRVILEKNINYTESFELTWKDKIFSIEFAALNYTLPEKCQYKYMLTGFDQDWVYTNADRRMASYSNLVPGTYTFKVMASNNDGKWGNNQKSVKIIVHPPFYRTMAFNIVIFILAIVGIYVIYRRRINLHKQKFEKQQKEQELKIFALEKEKLEFELKKLAFSIINKNKLLIDQKSRLQNLSVKARENVKEGLQKIVDSIDADLDEEKDWKYLEPQIDKAYNQFILKLKQKHPDLTTTEIRIAAYIRMNLTTKEISEFMNKTQRAVENDRYRLRKKIGLESNDSIQKYFLNL